MLFDEDVSLDPSFLFSQAILLEKNVKKKVPLLGKEQNIVITLSTQWISFEIPFSKRSFTSFFPDYSKGDAFELFLATRSMEDVFIYNKFVHHFVFLPGHEKPNAFEITKFRSHDGHDLASFRTLSCTQQEGSSMIEAVIQKNALYGFDLQNQQLFWKIAFRIYQKGEPVIDFPHRFSQTRVESSPALWANLIINV